MRVFDLTKTESILELVGILTDLQVDDIIVYAECVFGYIQNEYVIVFLKKLRELVTKIDLIFYDFNISNDTESSESQAISV
eukprot:CAMPEP_0116925584 /NCGR_PEP_ID=MMETSP0467-20121206/24210_1 /TAXON_ID=283647 /ORGANISM="Mesodinium pulex, Strain SPMC105" /LENGTH=80 /DNA_ID=CAMNT_0004604665 /DNA_START=438 /DNA_END=680 /DNA_ORIENTATION=-